MKGFFVPKLFLLLINILFCSLAFGATNTQIDLAGAGQAASVEFLALVKPGSLRINGTGGKATGRIEIIDNSVTGELTVQLDEIKTGISLRDTHMKEKFLETKKFPNAVLKITEMKLSENPFSGPVKMLAVPFKGTLNVHGVENNVTGSADIDSTGSAVIIEAKTKTTIQAHQIEKPSYLGIKVAEDIDLMAHLKLKK